jgi:HK97 family phage major capsid protein
MKRDSFKTVMKLKDGQGAYLLNSQMILQGAEKILLGKPIIFFNDMPSIAADSLSFAYGDFREGYTIIDRLGIRVIRDPFTNKPYIKFYTIKRVGGAVTNYQSFKILKLEE